MNPTPSKRSWKLLILGFALVVLSLSVYSAMAKSEPEPMPSKGEPRDFGRASRLPLPSSTSVAKYETVLFAFLNQREYVKLGWLADKGIRDTGPYIEGKYYGTHPAVRIYYSPGVTKWLKNGRVGTIPDGEMIIKEQYPTPAIRHKGKTEKQLWQALQSWTVMVKDSAGSHDGWFWSNPIKNQCVVDNHQYPFDHPVSGFGHYCVRCHASTKSPLAKTTGPDNEFAFIGLRNILGFPGQPIHFRVDDSWRKLLKNDTSLDGEIGLEQDAHPKCARPEAAKLPDRKVNPEFLAHFDSIGLLARKNITGLPPVTHDWVMAKRDPTQQFVTSNQCMSCHAGLVAPFGPSMFVPTGKTANYGDPGWDVSPYGEWRWTPMGLAGRDPIFFAQLESEVASLTEEHFTDEEGREKLCQTLADTCLRCHGAMGKKQWEMDHPDGKAKFGLAHVHAIAGPDEHIGHGPAKYGALARDGISCMVCHRMQPRPQPEDDKRPYLQFYLETSTTGNYHLGKPGEIYGPFKDDELAPYAMEHALGWKPKHSEYLKSSQLCGTCHVVTLPAVDEPLAKGFAHHGDDELVKSETVPAFRKFHHHVEQATYLEWLNSEFENEIDKDNPKAQTCQDCHMSHGLKDEKHGLDIPQLQTRIATIQDTTYPDAENLVEHKELDIRVRERGYRRHNFSGLNVFLVELFNQFDDVLGVRKTDFMTGSKQALEHAVESFMQTAKNDVADVELETQWHTGNRITARVLVKNKVGHRFPSGVGFRRAFLELLVVQREKPEVAPERIVWASGRTNSLGMLLDATGQPLPTEFFDKDTSGAQQYQPHHNVIRSQDQVQIYETLLHNAKGEFTTSFVRGCDRVKDNRLLPRGWKKNGPDPAVLSGAYLKATHPGPVAKQDVRYQDGSGTDEVVYQIRLPGNFDPTDLEVRATLYYQAIPPYFLKNLFEGAPNGPATRRLHYMCSHADLKGTPIEDWKLPIQSVTAEVLETRFTTRP